VTGPYGRPQFYLQEHESLGNHCQQFREWSRGRLSPRITGEEESVLNIRRWLGRIAKRPRKGPDMSPESTISGENDDAGENPGADVQVVAGVEGLLFSVQARTRKKRRPD
jgi:hypothetical protein